MDHFFALKQNSTTESRADIHDTFNILTLRVQTKHTVLFFWLRMLLIKIIVQEDYQGKLAQFCAMNSIVVVMDIRILVAKVSLLPF